MNQYAIKYGDLVEVYKLLTTYFGSNDPELSLNAVDGSLFMHNQDYILTEYTTQSEIYEACMTEMGIDLNAHIPIFDVLWFNANINGQERVEKITQWEFEELLTYSDQIYPEVKRDMLRLYALLKENTESKVRVTVNGKTVILNNYDDWLLKGYENHFIKPCFPEIDTPEAARTEVQRKAGRKIVRPVTNAVCYGVSQMFYDYGLITSVAPTNLCRFIRKYLYLMGQMTEAEYEKGEIIDENWIKVQIHKFRKSKEKPLIFTPVSEVVSLDRLLASEPERLFEHLYTPDTKK